VDVYVAIGLPMVVVLASLFVSLVQISGLRSDIKSLRADMREIRGDLRAATSSS